MSLIARFRNWFQYEREMHGKVLESLRAVPEAKRDDSEFQKAVDLLAHIAAARLLWLYRFGVIESGPESAEDLFPQNTTLDVVGARLATMHGLWSDYLERLDDEAIERTFEYRSVEGPRFRNRVEDLLAQLYGHSWYHRGQIASIVRRLGESPAITDYVFWTREAID